MTGILFPGGKLPSNNWVRSKASCTLSLLACFSLAVGIPGIMAGRASTDEHTAPVRKSIPEHQLANSDPHAPGIRLRGVAILGEQSREYGYSNTGIEVVLSDARQRRYPVTEEARSGLILGRLTDKHNRQFPDLFRVNRRGNLAALNIMPFHKGGEAILLRLGSDGKLVVDRDLGTKLTAICERTGRDFDASRMWVDHISGDVLDVRSYLQDTSTEYLLSVRVSAHGDLKVIHYHVRSDGSYETAPGMTFSSR